MGYFALAAAAAALTFISVTFTKLPFKLIILVKFNNINQLLSNVFYMGTSCDKKVDHAKYE